MIHSILVHNLQVLLNVCAKCFRRHAIPVDQCTGHLIFVRFTMRSVCFGQSALFIPQIQVNYLVAGFETP